MCVGGATGFPSRRLCDSSFSIIKPRVSDASMHQKPLVFLCKTYRGVIEASSRRHRGVIEASSRLSKMLGVLMQNLSRRHRGFIEASSRLHRGFQKPSVFLCQTDRGFIEALSRLSKCLVFLCKTYRGFIEASSRLAKTIGFTMQRLSRLHRGFQGRLILRRRATTAQHMPPKHRKKQPEPH